MPGWVAVAVLAVLVGCAVAPPAEEVADVVTAAEPIALPPPEPVPPPPPADLWERIERGLQFHALYNDRIAAARAHYLGQPRFFELIEPRAQRYLYHIVEEVERRELPLELALLPLVESAMNPFAQSPQGAAGLWQIMPGTADDLGVRRDWWFDGRLDVRESTRFALDHLESLYDDFDGDWLLALAAYNAGKYRVRRAVKHQRLAGLPDDFWSLSLPRETRHYVPRLIALGTLLAFDDALGIEWPTVANEPGFVAVDTGGQIEMLRAAELAGLSLRELRRYNPGNLRWATVPETQQALLVPPAAADTLRDRLAALAPDERVTWEHYRIRRGDSLIRIAKRFDTEVPLLREVNNISGNFIRAGDTLMIPDSQAWRDSLALAERGGGSVRRGYTVRRGDSLYRIASRFDVTIDELIQWNQLDPRRYLQPGQSLTLYIDGN